MEEIKTKVCSKCGRELPIENFYKNHTCKDGRCGTCKDCKTAYTKEWQKNNREKKKARKIEEERIAFESKYKIYTCKELAPFTPRELMLELKARGYTGDLLYQEVKVTEHRINLSKLDAPTMWEAQKWLREEYNLHIEITYSPSCWTGKIYDLKEWDYIKGFTFFESFEDALHTLIKEAVKILKEK